MAPQVANQAAVTCNLVICSVLKMKWLKIKTQIGTVAINGETMTTSPKCNAIYRARKPMLKIIPEATNQSVWGPSENRIVLRSRHTWQIPMNITADVTMTRVAKNGSGISIKPVLVSGWLSPRQTAAINASQIRRYANWGLLVVLAFTVNITPQTIKMIPTMPWWFSVSLKTIIEGTIANTGVNDPITAVAVGPIRSTESIWNCCASPGTNTPLRAKITTGQLPNQCRSIKKNGAKIQNKLANDSMTINAPVRASVDWRPRFCSCVTNAQLAAVVSADMIA